tara:strand:+ start:211 stop:447 length:237 start_codon:yes stop_codon:yes gene_type:complete
MRTLYNSLKPEYKEKLDINEEVYPVVIHGIKRALLGNELWSRLTISQVRDFIAFSDIALHSVNYEDWAFGTKFLIEED